jgi:kynurenine formamidase
MRGVARVLAVAVGVLAVAGEAAAQASWYPSKYGKDDTLGALNNLSPAGVLAAVKLVKTGKVYALGVVTGPATPAYGTRSYQIFTQSGSAEPIGSSRTTYHDDFLATWVGIGSQLDGLGHLGIDHRYYNGHLDSEFLRPNGLALFGVDKLPPIATRGVLLDVSDLPPGRAVNKAEIEAVVARQKTPIGKGDVVLLHTGWLAAKGNDKAAFLAGEPGLGKGGAEYLASLGVVAVGADSWGVEILPSEDPKEAFPVHQILLAKNGVYVLENMNVGPLAADRAWEFLFVLGQPRFEGAVQATINPVAIR